MNELSHKDAIACDIPDNHPMMENSVKEKLPAHKKLSPADFKEMIMASKSKGNLIWAERMFDRHGDKRGLAMVIQQYPEVGEKLKKYEIPVEGWEHLS